MKGYTDFMAGFFGFTDKSDHVNGMRFMDWEKVKQICADNPNSTIRAGLREDWNNTSGIIFSNGEYYDGYVYDQSRWATPIVDVDGTEIEVWTNEGHDTTGLPQWWGDGVELKSQFDCEDYGEDEGW